MKYLLVVAAVAAVVLAVLFTLKYLGVF